jgi:hypothetical protein
MPSSLATLSALIGLPARDHEQLAEAPTQIGRSVV